MDFSDVKSIANDVLVKRWDHAFLVYRGDRAVVDFLASLPEHKTVVLPVVPTRKISQPKRSASSTPPISTPTGNLLQAAAGAALRNPQQLADAVRQGSARFKEWSHHAESCLPPANWPTWSAGFRLRRPAWHLSAVANRLLCARAQIARRKRWSPRYAIARQGPRTHTALYRHQRGFAPDSGAPDLLSAPAPRDFLLLLGRREDPEPCSSADAW